MVYPKSAGKDDKNLLKGNNPYTLMALADL